MTTVDFDSPWLGWNPVEIWMGSSLFRPERHRLDLGWSPGDIRNCSYSPGTGKVGITAEDRTAGGQVLAIHERSSKSTRVVLRRDVILRHALGRMGSKVCFTIPSRTPGSAELYVHDVSGGDPRRVVDAGLAHASTPSWFPDDARIAYGTVDGQIEIVDLGSETRTAITDGESPAVSVDGDRVAFRRDGELMIWHVTERQLLPIGGLRGWRRRDVVAGPGWSLDGTHLVFGIAAGLVGKETEFYVLDIATGDTQKTELHYLTGVLLGDAALRPSDS
jgi:dipeptidyl aminopeptidase/acylaminoacyl peptidase